MLAGRRFATCAICAAIGLVASKVDAQAQTAGVTRTILRKIEYLGDKYATIQVLAEVEANALVARHTHPGVETAYVLEGEGVLKVKGQPDRKVGVDDGFEIPPEVPHSLQAGGKKMRIAGVYVVEKDKPLASPAPE